MKKDLFAIFVIVFVVILILSGTKIQSVDDYYLSHLDDIREDSETVFLTVVCTEALADQRFPNALRESGAVPQDGMILVKTEYVLRPNDTVYTVFDRAVRHNKIAVEYVKALDGSVYVKGISQLYEYDCGALSGWVFSVNGMQSELSCDRTLLADGDEIVWYYTLTLGAVAKGGGGS